MALLLPAVRRPTPRLWTKPEPPFGFGPAEETESLLGPAFRRKRLPRGHQGARRGGLKLSTWKSRLRWIWMVRLDARR